MFSHRPQCMHIVRLSCLNFVFTFTLPPSPPTFCRPLCFFTAVLQEENVQSTHVHAHIDGVDSRRPHTRITQHPVEAKGMGQETLAGRESET